MIRHRIPTGTTIHIQGIPFRLAYDAIIEGHEANFGLIDLQRTPEEVLRRSVEYMSRPWWDRACLKILRWFR